MTTAADVLSGKTRWSFCPPDGVVCDPFAGSGTTLHAAVVHGRRAVGCETARQRLDQTTRQLEVGNGQQGESKTGRLPSGFRVRWR